MSEDLKTIVTVLTVIIEAAIIFVGIRLIRNHRKAIEALRIEEALDIASKDFMKYRLRGSSYGIPIAISSAFMLLVLIPVAAAFLEVRPWGEPTTDADMILIYGCFMFFGVFLTWAVFAEVSLPRSVVTERGVWNITGLTKPFLIRWDEIEAVVPSKYPTQDKWYVIKGRQGIARVSSLNDLSYLASMLMANVPKEKWSNSAPGLRLRLPRLGDHPPRPMTRAEANERAKAAAQADATGRGVVWALIFPFLSSGIMLWASFDIATDPSYGGLVTLEDWLSWSVVAVPNLVAIIALIVAWRKWEARWIIFACMLSGFSFLSPMVVIGQFFIWRAYRKGVIPWGPRVYRKVEKW